MSTILQDLDRIKNRISDSAFLNNKGLSNEVGIHVFCYSPADEIVVQDYVRRLGAKGVVHGEIMDIRASSAKEKLDAAMNGLVESVYYKLNMVNHFVESEADIFSILNGSQSEAITLVGTGANNEEAPYEISQWLELQNSKLLNTSMGDVQRRYTAI